MSDDEEKAIAEFLDKMNKFSSRETESCPYCGEHVLAMRKIGRCVYVYPCGCRLWQGSIPAAWKSAEVGHV